MPKKFFTVSKRTDVIQKISSLITLSPFEEEMDILSVVSRVASRDVFASFSIPSFKKSLVDGFAVHCEDTGGASNGNPIPLKLVGETHIGDFPSICLADDEAVFTPTGGVVVDGADAVVMFEYTEMRGNEIFITKEVSKGENVLPVGDDIQKDSIILEKGDFITPEKVAGIRSFGIKKVFVFKPVKVGIFATGDELYDEGELGKGKIYDSNSYALAAEVIKDGFIANRYEIVKDDKEKIISTLKTALNENDVVLMSGGTSKGSFDFTVEAIDLLGKPGVVIHGMHLSPGKPTVFGVIDGKLIVGLSGNPLASFLVYRSVVRNIIFQKMGIKLKRKVVFAEITENIPSRKGREEFIIGKFSLNKSKNFVTPIFSESAFVSPLLFGDGIITIPLMSEGLKKGEKVMFELW